MDDEKKRKLKDREKVFDNVFYIVLIFVVVVVGFYIFNFLGKPLSDKAEDWGVFGDFIGGTLNPLLAFFSFMLLLLNLKLQREQLDNTEEQLELTRNELELTRIELEKAADAQIDSSRVMNEQLKTQFLQQFDTLFTHMVDQLNKFYEFINHENLNGLLKSFHSWKYIKHRVDCDPQFIRYESYLILVLKHINSVKLAQTEKQLYVDLIKSTLPYSFLKIINISAVDIDDEFYKKEYRDLLSYFNFFENLKLIDNNPKETTMLTHLTKHFDSNAYRNNSDFNTIVKSWCYTELLKDYHEMNLSCLIKNQIKAYSYFKSHIENLIIKFDSKNTMAMIFNGNEIANIEMKEDISVTENYFYCTGVNFKIGFGFHLSLCEHKAELKLRWFGEEDLKSSYGWDVKQETSFHGVLA